MVHRKFAGKSPSRMGQNMKNKGKPIQVTEVENCCKTPKPDFFLSVKIGLK